MSESEVLVVVPTYNEAETILTVVSRVRAQGYDVLIVDDGSTDGTGGLVRARGEQDSRIHILERDRKLGLGRAYVAGFQWGLERRYRYYIEMDADLSHDPSALPGLIQAASITGIAIGSRYVVGGNVVGWKEGRHALSKAGNLYARLALGFGVRDSTSGFRCYRRDVLEKIEITKVASDGYSFQIDMAYRAWRAGFRIVEVPITFSERRAGESKMSKAIVLEAIARVTGWGARDVLSGRRWVKRSAGVE